ncbi:MAG: hypothetical protein ACSLE0_02330, partial [Chitinophagaceae bacterium]
KISDNGVGFDVLSCSNGIGLANMRRRTKLFSGQFDLVSSPGQGCEIIISIPLNELGPTPVKLGKLKVSAENEIGSFFE